MIINWVGVWCALLMACVVLGAVAFAGEGDVRSTQVVQRAVTLLVIFSTGFAVGLLLVH